MQREIGSDFWITPRDLEAKGGCFPEAFGCAGTDRAWLSTGRSCISFVLEEAGRRNPDMGKIALIPAFTCHTVIEPFLKEGYAVHTYPMERSLCTDGGPLLDAVKTTGASIILLHRYFGFDTLLGCVEAIEVLRKRGVIVVEDRTQCLYSGFTPLPADYWVGSIRKWAGIPSGGFAVCREGSLSGKPAESDLELEAAKIAAGTAKYQYFFENRGDKPSFLKLYQKAEKILDWEDRYYAMGDLSARMQASLCTEVIRRKRRENYLTLLYALDGCSCVRPMFSSLPENVVPLYFPVWVEGDRKSFQAWLRDADIYAPVVWPRPEMMPSVCQEAEDLYEQLLCIPIDQRYDKDDMERIAGRVKMVESGRV